MQLVLLVMIIVAVVVFAVRHSKRDGAPKAGGTTNSTRPTNLGASTASIDRVLQAASLAVASVPKHRLSPGTPGTLIIDQEYWAWWRVAIAVVLFPIGLLALVTRDRRTATVVARRGSNGVTQLTVSGSASPALVNALQRSIPARAPSARHKGQLEGREPAEHQPVVLRALAPDDPERLRQANNPDKVWRWLDAQYGDGFDRSLHELEDLLSAAALRPRDFDITHAEVLESCGWLDGNMSPPLHESAVQAIKDLPVDET